MGLSDWVVGLDVRKRRDGALVIWWRGVRGVWHDRSGLRVNGRRVADDDLFVLPSGVAISGGEWLDEVIDALQALAGATGWEELAEALKE